MRTIPHKSVTAGILAFLAALLWAPMAAQAFTPWTGRVSANINLRAAPGLNGRIITGLDRNALVQVRDQQGEWYQIERQSDTFGYIGWVYGKYVVAVSENAPLSAGQVQGTSTAPATPPAPAVTAAPATAPPALPKASRPSPQAAPTKAAPRPEIAPPSPVKQGTTAVLAVSNPAPALAAPPAVKPSVISQVSPKVPPSAPAARPIHETARQLPKADVPVTVVSSPESAPARLSQPPAPAMATPAAAPAKDYAGPRAVVGLLLRLTTTMVACLALLLAFKALQTARGNRALILERSDLLHRG